MNLLFYCSEYPPYKTGGIGTVTKIVAEELVRRGHIVSVIGYYPDISEKFVDELINGVRVVRYNLGYRNSHIKDRLFVMLRKLGISGFITKRELSFIEGKIEAYIVDNKIDVLELTDYYPFVLCNSKLEFKKFSVPTVLRIHGSASFIQNLSGRGKSCYDENDQRHFQRCDHVSAVSRYSLNYVKNKFHLPAIQTWNVIYNPIEDSFLKKNEPVNNDHVLFIGKLTETKGCYSLVRAFNICAEKHPTLQLKLAGKGDETKVKELIDPKYIDRVHFLGYCDRERIKEEIDTCAFACIPSYFENFSMVPLEIMSRAKAIIYTDRTSGNEIISDGYNGFLVDPEDIQLIAEKMHVLLENQDLCQSMAVQAYGCISDKFMLSRVVSQQEMYYSSLISCNEKAFDNK